MTAAVAAGRDLDPQQLRMLAMDERALAGRGVATAGRASRQRHGRVFPALTFVADQLQAAAQHLPDRIYLTTDKADGMSDIGLGLSM